MNKNAETNESSLASHWNQKFKEAMVAKAPYTKRWNDYYNAYNGDYFKNANLPDYKSDLVANYIFATVETIRPIMLDNDPRFQSMPRNPAGMRFSTDLNETFAYEWDREKMTTKLYRELINLLVIGSNVFFVPWDSKEKQVRSIPVDPFNLFPSPLATSVDDAEYIIYASYKNVLELKRLFPDKADRLTGGNVNFGELVNDNNRNSNVDNQVLVLEAWSRDHVTSVDVDGMEKKYPNGRVTTVCPELGIVLSDKANPYQDGKFPFIVGRDYDVPGKFWGEGEVAQLISPQKYMNELNNAVIDNAKSTANAPWIVDKSAGIPVGSINNRQGLVIRKNQGSEVRREQPANMPGYVINAVETLKHDIEQVSGIFDSLKGNSATGVYTAQGILALQEAGQARIRLKVKLMEEMLGELASMWFSRMSQFWKEDKWLRMTHADGSYDFRKLKREAMDQEYDIRILAGSTMPVNRGAMLDLMIRLAQTQMSDGQSLVDREAVAEYLPSEVKATMLERMQGKELAIEQQVQQLMQGMEQMQQGFQQGMQQMQEELGGGLKEVGQQVQQVVQETQANDAQTMEVIEELAGAIEKVGGDILQMQTESDTIKQTQEEEAKTAKLKSESYNSGYGDAEKHLSSDSMEDEGLMEGEGFAEGLGKDADMGLEIPDDILAGLEALSADELAVLLESNPELADLLE